MQLERRIADPGLNSQLCLVHPQSQTTSTHVTIKRAINVFICNYRQRAISVWSQRRSSSESHLEAVPVAEDELVPPGCLFNQTFSVLRCLHSHVAHARFACKLLLNMPSCLLFRRVYSLHPSDVWVFNNPIVQWSVIFASR